MGDADRLPMANVNRIVMSTLPKDAAVAKEAKVAISACATVFVHYITELAVQQCDKRKKVTLQYDDIMEAIREAEFNEFEEPLKEALSAFRAQNNATKKPAAKKQKLNDSTNDGEGGAGGSGAGKDEGGEEEDGAMVVDTSVTEGGDETAAQEGDEAKVEDKAGEADANAEEAPVEVDGGKAEGEDAPAPAADEAAAAAAAAAAPAPAAE